MSMYVPLYQLVPAPCLLHGQVLHKALFVLKKPKTHPWGDATDDGDVFVQRSHGDGERSGSEGSEDGDYVPYVPVKIRKHQLVSCSELSYLKLHELVGNDLIVLFDCRDQNWLYCLHVFYVFFPTATENVATAREGGGRRPKGQRGGSEGRGGGSRSSL